MSASGWIGVDLDGTLAFYEQGKVYTGEIGDPVPAMVERVKAWLAEGTEVRILTARVAEPQGDWPGRELLMDPVAHQRELIEQWCELHIGARLKVTAQKDFAMIEMWDDRAVSVEFGTGRAVSFVAGEAVSR